MFEISEIIAQAQQKGASDIHIVTGLPVKCRIDGKVQNLTEKVLTWENCEYYAKCLAGDLFHEIECIGELDLARTFPCGARTRINLFRQQGAVSAAIRILADTIPEIEALNLPPVVSEFPEYRSGIILVTGETGSGKSTTLAAILNRINHTRRSHIITLEDPIEYIYEPDQCIINQREIGKDTRSYADGLRPALFISVRSAWMFLRLRMRCAVRCVKIRTLFWSARCVILKRFRPRSGQRKRATWSSPPCTQTPQRIPLTAW